jgi:hypothetical protein
MVKTVFDIKAQNPKWVIFALFWIQLPCGDDATLHQSASG